MHGVAFNWASRRPYDTYRFTLATIPYSPPACTCSFLHSFSYFFSVAPLPRALSFHAAARLQPARCRFITSKPMRTRFSPCRRAGVLPPSLRTAHTLPFFCFSVELTLLFTTFRLCLRSPLTEQTRFLIYFHSMTGATIAQRFFADIEKPHEFFPSHLLSPPAAPPLFLPNPQSSPSPTTPPVPGPFLELSSSPQT